MARLYTADELLAVHRALQTALEQGISLKKFKDMVSDIITRPWHAETVFRTNIQTAYQVGRYRQMSEEIDVFPYWMYDAVNDSRTRPSHALMDGKVYPATHPFWKRWYPPNGYNCRCSVIPLREKEAQKYEINTDMPALEPDPGFHTNPGEDYFGTLEQIWKDKIKRYPQGFAKTLEDEFGKIKSVQDIDKIIKTKLAGEFKKEYSGITLTDEKYFMATDPSNGSLFISSKEFPHLNNFSPLNDLLAALNKLGKEKLSFNEEYALESLWHEIVHNKQVLAPIDEYDETIMEIVTQWYARRTYPNLLKKLGDFEALHQKDIIKKGYGYFSKVAKLDNLLEELDIRDNDIIGDIEDMILSTPWNKYAEKLAEILAKKTGGNRNGLLNRIYLLSFEFIGEH